MKQRFILYRRNNGKFYAEDTVTKKQSSLKTRDEAEAHVILNAKNEAFRQPILNLRIARTYLSATDGEAAKRTWQQPGIACSIILRGMRSGKPCCIEISGGIETEFDCEELRPF